MEIPMEIQWKSMKSWKPKSPIEVHIPKWSPPCCSFPSKRKMSRLLLQIVLLGALCVASCAYDTVHGVPLLTSANFKEETEGKNAIIKFYAPWCGHCKRMTPAWNELHEHHGDTKLVVAKVDCTSDASREICKELGIRGFPTVKYQVSHKENEGWQDYHQARDIVQLKAFAEKTFIHEM